MRSKKGSSVDSQSHIEIVNIEDDYPFFCTPISRIDKDEAISAEGKSTPAVNFIDLCYDDVDDEDDDCRVLMFQPSNTQFRKRRKTENGESSNSNTKNDFPSFVCEICVDYKPANELFGIQNCSHSYCKDCINNYVASKLQENITIIKCPVPDCKGSLDLEYCRPILPPEVYDKWGNALCEAMIVGSQRFYCPFKDCSALLIDDEPEDVVRESECPNCYRMFCAQCKVPWHAGIGCREIQQLNEYEREKEVIMLMNIAKKKKWRRCPNCSIYVEKWTGCDHVRCRCGVKFNYSKVARIGGKEPLTMKKPVRKKPCRRRVLFTFIDEFRLKYREEHPNQSAAARKAAVEKWKSMSKSEKASYTAMVRKR